MLPVFDEKIEFQEKSTSSYSFEEFGMRIAALYTQLIGYKTLEEGF